MKNSGPKNRYSLQSDYKNLALYGMICFFLESGKSVSVFVNGCGHVYEIGDCLLELLNKGEIDCSNFKIMNCNNFKKTEIPTDISIAIDGTGYKNDKWMYQSQLNIIIE